MADETPLVPPFIHATEVGEPSPPSVPDWRGPHVQTANGGHWWPFSPRPEDVRLEDIVASLRRGCRFGGHLREGVESYSVLEHQVRVSWLLRNMGASPLECFGGLHHDSDEAYPPNDQIGPFLRGMKDPRACALLGLTPAAFEGILAVRRRAQDAVRTAFAISDVFADARSAALIHKADMTLLATERRDLMAYGPVDWGTLPEPMLERIRPWSPHFAAEQFMSTHATLLNAMGRP